MNVWIIWEDSCDDDRFRTPKRRNLGIYSKREYADKAEGFLPRKEGISYIIEKLYLDREERPFAQAKGMK